ncbi:MAG: DNA repair protein RadC [Pseudanabaenaceae cyanobacterium bins.68]|nr:DNA repair protein RadC [Pseudanabaenaceae cyanobacterium bins.68]
MTYSLRIADMVEAERPRERLLQQGGRYLSSAELLAILLGTGQGAGKLSAVGLGQLILQTLSRDGADPLANLQTVHPHELMAIAGVGPAKATSILAAIELGKRVFSAKPPERAEITDPTVAVAALSHDLMWQQEERLAVLLLDNRNRMIGQKLLTIGSANETIADPKDIFREVIKSGAVKFMVAHNHPSGNLQPSQADLDLTAQLLTAATWLNLPLLDHLILGNGGYCSLREVTKLWQ